MFQVILERGYEHSFICDEDQGGCSTTGNIISVGAKSFRCAGVLLQPRLVYQCDVDIRQDLYANVVLSARRSSKR